VRRVPEEEEKEKVINLLSGNNSATSDLLAVSNVYDVELSWLSASLHKATSILSVFLLTRVPTRYGLPKLVDFFFAASVVSRGAR
jgi:hypothetical protein